jgi:hypothetical protein
VAQRNLRASAVELSFCFEISQVLEVHPTVQPAVELHMQVAAPGAALERLLDGRNG